MSVFDAELHHSLSYNKHLFNGKDVGLTFASLVLSKEPWTVLSPELTTSMSACCGWPPPLSGCSMLEETKRAEEALASESHGPRFKCSLLCLMLMLGCDHYLAQIS